MKNLLLIFTLLFSSVFVSSPSYAEWTKLLGTSSIGDTFYVDYERIRKYDGFVYYWRLTDFLLPNEIGDLSGKSYNQGDCKLFRFKILSCIFYTELMGRGSGRSETAKNPEWNYPPPNSINELMLKQVCSR